MIDQCLTYQKRNDLAAESVGDGRNGFELWLPAGVLMLSQGHDVSLRREGNAQHPPGLPYTLEPIIRMVREPQLPRRHYRIAGLLFLEFLERT